MAPRWVVGAGGGVLAAAGLVFLARSQGKLPGMAIPLVVTPFRVIFTWIAFGSGELQFAQPIDFDNGGGISVIGSLSRLCFAPLTGLLDLMAVNF